MFQLNEFDELISQAYMNAQIYKKRAKLWHEKKFLPRSLEDG